VQNPYLASGLRVVNESSCIQECEVLNEDKL